VDPTFRKDNRDVPLVTALHPGLVFDPDALAQALALEAERGVPATDDQLDQMLRRRPGGVTRRFTPASNWLHDRLRDVARLVIADDLEYTATFDRFEMLLALIVTDATDQVRASGDYVEGPWYGSFTWRNKYARVAPEAVLHEEFLGLGANWSPLGAGLFGGSLHRAETAFESLLKKVPMIRQHQA
jgi:hypothetical protein